MDLGHFDVYGDEEPDIVCFGGIIVTLNMKAFLTLPSKFRIFLKLTKPKPRR